MQLIGLELAVLGMRIPGWPSGPIWDDGLFGEGAGVNLPIFVSDEGN
jgi:hypothetical protein